MTASSSEYAEVKTYLRGRFRPLNGPDDQPYAQINTLPGGISREEFISASPMPEAVNKFLAQMDEKMDALLATLRSSSIEQDFPHAMEIFSISAGKLLFTSALPLVVGDWLEVLVNFGQTGIVTASGIGHIAAREVGADSTPVFSFSFTRIQEEEREKIIRYVFKEERRLLRETRLEQPGEPV